MRIGSEQSSTKVAKESPTIKEIHWAAGLFEGEGHISFAGGTEQVGITMTDVEPLEKMLYFFGGNIKGPYRSKTNKKDAFRWIVSGGRARGVLMTLYPLLSPRRKTRIKRVLKEQM